MFSWGCIRLMPFRRPWYWDEADFMAYPIVEQAEIVECRCLQFIKWWLVSEKNHRMQFRELCAISGVAEISSHRNLWPDVMNFPWTYDLAPEDSDCRQQPLSSVQSSRWFNLSKRVSMPSMAPKSSSGSMNLRSSIFSSFSRSWKSQNSSLALVFDSAMIEFTSIVIMPNTSRFVDIYSWVTHSLIRFRGNPIRA